jgi:hypothetical protein
MSSRTKQPKTLRRSARNRQTLGYEAPRMTQDITTTTYNKDWLEAEWFRQWEALARQPR